MRLLFLFFAVPAFGADLGSPVPMPTGDTRADVAAIVAHLERVETAIAGRLEAVEKASAEVSARLASLENRVTAGERFASAKAGYVPPPAMPPALTSFTPPLGVAAGVPTGPAIGATPVAGTSTTWPGSYRVVSMSTAAPAGQSGGTEYRTGPLGLIRWRVGSSGGGGGCLSGYCGGADPTPEFRTVRYGSGQ